MFMLTLTIVSVIAAIVAAVCAWRVARTDRLRSEARIAALAASLDELPGPAGPPETPESQFEAPMFIRPARAGLLGRPLLKVGVGFVMAIGAVVLLAMSGDRHTSDVVVRTPVAGATPGTGTLELLSMRHARTGDSFTVSGIVRGADAAAPGSVTAIVFVFDREGGFVASGRAPLDPAPEAAGTPFRVTIPDVADVGRYRVSFRTGAGVLPHVDRREPLQASSAG